MIGAANDLEIFDRRQVRLQRDRAAESFTNHDVLFREVAKRLADRLLDVECNFPLALDLGCHGGGLADQLPKKSGIETLVQCDLSPAMARQAGANALVADEEMLPFADQKFDLVASNLSLHWVNDLPGTLIQIRRGLKGDGLFVAALLGSGTLMELRECLTDAEIETHGGAGPRLSPLPALGDAAALLQRAGFAMPVADGDTLTFTYTDAFQLLADLRGMGEANAVVSRRKSFTARTVLMRAAALYLERFARPDGTIPATFQVIYLHGWAPHASQRRALAPGSATTRLASALETEEQPAGDVARPGRRPVKDPSS